MTTPAYSQSFLDKAARAIGSMLHDAVVEYGLDGEAFLTLFIRSGVAEQVEDGNPKYIAGKSGLELFLEVMEKTSDRAFPVKRIEAFDRSPVFWVGWMLTQYQWYSGRTFRRVLETVSYEDFLSLYGPLHEVDVRKGYEVLDSYFSDNVSRLKAARKQRGLTQEALAQKSGISLNTIRAYERKSKDLNKAQVDNVMKLARALQCDVTDLVD